MKIDINKKYRTRDGMEVRLLHRTPEGWPTSYPWRGIVGDASHLSWTDHGVQDVDDSPSDDDLIEVREPREGWIPNYSLYETESAAMAMTSTREAIRVREIID